MPNLNHVERSANGESCRADNTENASADQNSATLQPISHGTSNRADNDERYETCESDPTDC
jgi:hypothetical protein